MKKKLLFHRKTLHLENSIIVLLFITISGITNNIYSQSWTQIYKGVASDRGSNDEFGSNVAIHGDYAIVGSTLEDHSETGKDSLDNAGAVYIYKKNSIGKWSQVQKIVASDRVENDYFGRSLAIYGDYIVVGAINNSYDESGKNRVSEAGSAYIFKNTNGTWLQVQKIVASDRNPVDAFGISVSINEDYLIVGSASEDHDAAGKNYLINAGSAYIFKNNSGTWTQIQKIVASDRSDEDRFGFSVSIYKDFIIVGAFNEDEDLTGSNTILGAGSAYIFKNNSGTWTQTQKLIASDRGANDIFGVEVKIAEEYAIIGAPSEDHNTLGLDSLNNAGSAYIFKKNNNGNWFQIQKIVAPDRESFGLFGYSISISDDYAVIGASRSRKGNLGDNNIYSAGSAYLFKNNLSVWSEYQKIIASDREINDCFGSSVAISGKYAIVGAYYEDHNETGNKPITNAGSSYIYKNCPIIRSTDIQRACYSFTWIDGETYTSSNNTATYTFTTDNGCDSVVTLNLTILSNKTTDVHSSCYPYTWIDGNTYTSSNNTAQYTLTNSAGCDSIVTLSLTIYPTTGTDKHYACDSFIWMDGKTYKESNNFATHNLTNIFGCDSIVTLNLILYGGVSILTTSLSEKTIKALNYNSTYQWLNCDNNYEVIDGEKKQTFSPKTNGNYAVELTENGCVDTSACISVNTIEILENNFENKISIYPNPSNGIFIVDLGTIFQNAKVSIIDIFGRELYSKTSILSQIINFTIDEPEGLYFISIQSDNKKIVLRFIKE